MYGPRCLAQRALRRCCKQWRAGWLLQPGALHPALPALLACGCCRLPRRRGGAAARTVLPQHRRGLQPGGASWWGCSRWADQAARLRVRRSGSFRVQAHKCPRFTVHDHVKALKAYDVLRLATRPQQLRELNFERASYAGIEELLDKWPAAITQVRAPPPSVSLRATAPPCAPTCSVGAACAACWALAWPLPAPAATLIW